VGETVILGNVTARELTCTSNSEIEVSGALLLFLTILTFPSSDERAVPVILPLNRQKGNFVETGPHKSS